MTPSLSCTDSILSVIGAGFGTYLIFKRTETYKPFHLAILLLGVPAALTLLLYPFPISLSLLVTAFTTFALYWSTIAISILVYRLSPWHPLAKYPGPIICRVSKFHLAILSLSGKQHEYFRNLHRMYGPIVRVGPNELSIIESAAIEPIMGLPKGPYWTGRHPQRDKPLIALRDRAEHARRRRPWARAFSSTALKAREDLLTKRCVQLAETLGTQEGVVDMSQWIAFWSYDVMADLTFGRGPEMMRDGDAEGIWHLLEASQKPALFTSHVPWLAVLALKLPNVAREWKTFIQYTRREVLNRRKIGSPHKDIFYYLSDEAGVLSTPPKLAELIGDSTLAVLAGADTTGNTIVNLLYCILRNPGKYQRLQAEIDEVGDEIMDYGKQSHMPYLNATINETLRLYPPVLSGSQRYTEGGSGGMFVGDKYIPERTTVFVPTYAIQRDPRYFSPLPDSFIPERWLSREEQIKLEPGLFANELEVRHDAACFLPFSHGPSNCVGKNLAYMEMRMAMCVLMQSLEFRLADEKRAEKWDERILDYFAMLKDGLPVLLKVRK